MSTRLHCEVAVAGAGFAGAIAARVLAGLGYEVVLLERGRHPRFALGESSTPLGALSLRRLAERYGLPDLEAFTSHGRWLRAHPELRRGLKRGFSFYAHLPGEPLDGTRRLLVAASPSDELADTHWLREDVDHFLTERAKEAGVIYLDGVEITHAVISEDGIELRGAREEDEVSLRTGFVIDAAGGGLLERLFPEHFGLIHRGGSDLLFAHLAGVEDVAGGRAWPPPPYPEHRAAVHHLLAEGWAYVLPFDHGVASVGFLLDPRREASAPIRALAAREPAAAWSRLLARYPSLEASLGNTVATVGPAFRPRIRFRRAHATAERCLCLPSGFAFNDPLFSTGIAWSLLGIERVGRLFEGREPPGAEALACYESLLAREADHLDALIELAYGSFDDFRAFAASSMLYFAAASFGEARQRLCAEERDWPWEGFLGAGDETVVAVLAEAPARLEWAHGAGGGAYEAWLAEAIAPRNVAGLADPARHGLYPADVATVLAAAGRLGLTERVARERLPLLLR